MKESSTPANVVDEEDADAPGAKKRNFGTFAILGAIALLIMVGVYMIQKPGQQNAQSGAVASVQVSVAPGAKAPAVGDVAPGFTSTTLDGKRVSLAEFKGKPVWLAFGATWCAPCRVEAPDIQAAYEKNKANGTTILAVYLSESPTAVRDYTSRVGLTYTHIPDPQTTIAGEYQVSGIPVHYFIGRDGVVKKVHVGILSPAQIQENLALIQQ